MKFTCNQQTLSKALNIVSKAISARTTIPVLKGILMTVENQKLILSASDLDISIEHNLEVNGEKDGSVVVGAKLFGDIIRKLPGNEEISVEKKEDGNVLIKTLSSEFNIVGTAADEFPGIGSLDETKATLSFDAEMLSDMIRKTYFCSSPDESKGIIVGILMEIEKDFFNMVALDGFRMAVAREKKKNSEDQKIVVSARILSEVNKIIGETGEKGEITFLVGEKKAKILLKNTVVIMRVMEGEFVKYKDILPTEKKTTLVVNRGELLTSLDRASLLAKEGKNNLVRFKIEENLISMVSTSEEGNVKEELIMDKEGSNIEIGFNSKYISDALKAIQDEEIVMEFNTPTTPCLIKPLEGNRFEYLILPVRIPSN